MTNKKTKNTLNLTQKIVGIGLFTAIVFVLQFIGRYIHFGVFSISLVLVPIVIGAILFGAFAGAWLGFSFGLAVLLYGDAAPFLAVNPVGTVVTVLLKGIIAGLAARGMYNLVKTLSKDKEKNYVNDENSITKKRSDFIKGKNEIIATFIAAFIAPVANTLVFLLGCFAFFMPTLREWAAGKNVLVYMMTGLVGVNFLIELAINMILSSTILRLVEIGRKTSKK